ncbi:MAG: hypothetical protein EP330_23100 [Deltaproteobacteria bacterium]|nr:MAG: hypothetical protein EP330_23100 [Deltaproteobacteria bacterium]
MPRWTLHPKLGAILQVRVDQGHWALGMQSGTDGGLTDTLPQPLTVWGLIDTGAALTCVRGDVAERLRLVSAGTLQIYNVGAHLDQDARVRTTTKRHARLQIEGLGTFEVEAAEVSEFKGVGDVDIVVLIGRDVLSKCVLTVDGPAGAFSLRRP